MKLGEVLVNQGVISEDMLAQALQEQKTDGEKIGATLIRMGFVSEEEMLNALAKYFGVRSVNLKAKQPNEAVLKLLPGDIAAKYMAVPVSRFGRKLTLAMVDPHDVTAIQDIKFATGFEIEPVVANFEDIAKIIENHYRVQRIFSDVMMDMDLESAIGEGMDTGQVEVKERKEEDLAYVVEDGDSGPALKLASKIISDAVALNVSDVHIEPYEADMRVRYRIDGILHEIMKPPKKLNRALATVIKVMGRLKVEEKRLPQDGRIKARVHNKIIDIRVSTVPTLFGEKIALRILDRSAIQLNLDLLGFEAETLAALRRAINTPYGIVLVTGPTGSGKTTTLYSALTELNDPGLNIITAEDPIEYSLTGISQLQVNERIGLTFASALRAYLRQDPNIIMVGEIRDLETAEIAIRASLTGHLVLSTVHTNSAAATVTRLVNMDVEPFLIASTLLAVQSQRLLRKTCTECRETVEYPDEALLDAGLDPKNLGFKLYRGNGCKYCRGTGYRGRIGAFETMLITGPIREAILRGASNADIEQTAVENGMITLRESALTKLRDGVTTLEEVIRETKVE